MRPFINPRNLKNLISFTSHYPSKRFSSNAFSTFLNDKKQFLFITKAKEGKDSLEITWNNGLSSRFHYIWLRDHCQCPLCKHPETEQRLIDTVQIPLSIKPLNIKISAENSDHLMIHWPIIDQLHTTPMDQSESCVNSTFTSEWLFQNVYDVSDDQKLKDFNKDSRKAWKSMELMESFPTATYENVIQKQENGEISSVYKKALTDLYKYGVIKITNCPPTVSAAQNVGETFGFILRTLYGTMWTTSPESPDEDFNDTASTNWALTSHTDCTYLYNPPKLQLFLCTKQSQSGGKSRLVDGLMVCQLLKEKHPHVYEFFKRIRIPAVYIDKEYQLKTMESMIEENEYGEVSKFRLNDSDRNTLSHLSFEDMQLFYKYHKIVLNLIRLHELEAYSQLSPGEMIIVDNHRVMHGREAFEGSRALVGCYIGEDEYWNTLHLNGIL